jgi:hypothetical protein
MSLSSHICDLRKPTLSSESLCTNHPRYELLKWEEYQQTKHGQGIKRELEWATIAREIALMNRPYSR